jgi:hypothetical protein
MRNVGRGLKVAEKVVVETRWEARNILKERVKYLNSSQERVFFSGVSLRTRGELQKKENDERGGKGQEKGSRENEYCI